MKTSHSFIYFILLFISNTILRAQIPNLEWAKSMGGPTGQHGVSIEVDASGNVYSTGGYSATADFDPGPGVFNLTAAGQSEIYVSKLDASGNFIWAKSIGGPLHEDVHSLTLDASGNIYITGRYRGTCDFDPGPGTYNLTAPYIDGFVLKLDNAGNFVWAKNMTGTAAPPFTDECDAAAVKVDNSGNVYVTGYFQGDIDFDPSPSFFILTSVSVDPDVFVLKLDASGSLVWAKSIGGSSIELGRSIVLDAAGNPYITVAFKGTTDFDPNPGTYFFTALGGFSYYDMAVVKWNGSGNLVWAKQFSGTSNITGESSAKDGSGNLIITGSFEGTADFDPGPSIASLNSNGSKDVFLLKIDPLGNYLWAKGFGGINNEIGNSVAVDTWGNMYTTGGFSGMVDFDPGIGLTYLTSNSPGLFISKLDASGNFSWAREIEIVSDDLPAITVNASKNIYLTGTYSGTCDFDPNAPIFNLTSLGTRGIFVLKLDTCAAPLAPVDLTPLNNKKICQQGITTLSVSGAGLINWYTSSTSTIVLSTGLTYNPSTLNPGTFTLYVETITCVNSLTRTAISLTVNPLPNVTVNNGVICAGQSFTIIPSGANSYTISGGSAIVTPPNSTSYTVAGSNLFGCVNNTPAICEVTVNPLPNVMVNSGVICTGQSFTIIPSGANSYTISGGSSIVTPANTTSYTVMGSNQFGCINSTLAICEVTVNACVGIETQVSTENLFQIFPNPGDGLYNLYLHGNAQIIVSTIYGQEIVNENRVSGKQALNLENAANGIYFLKVIIDKKSITTCKIVKE